MTCIQGQGKRDMSVKTNDTVREQKKRNYLVIAYKINFFLAKCLSWISNIIWDGLLGRLGFN